MTITNRGATRSTLAYSHRIFVFVLALGMIAPAAALVTAVLTGRSAALNAAFTPELQRKVFTALGITDEEAELVQAETVDEHQRQAVAEVVRQPPTWDAPGPGQIVDRLEHEKGRAVGSLAQVRDFDDVLRPDGRRCAGLADEALAPLLVGERCGVQRYVEGCKPLERRLVLSRDEHEQGSIARYQALPKFFHRVAVDTSSLSPAQDCA